MRKALALFVDNHPYPKLGEADPRVSEHYGSLDGSIVFFFFQKKKQKALFRFAEDGLPKTRRSRPRGFGGVPPKNRSVFVNRLYKSPEFPDSILPFLEKEAKSVVPLGGRR
jgi:hypothetical protein